MGLLFSLFAFLLGLQIGSFLNVCIYRIPRGESLISPRSHCPHCQKPIKWFDNIPLLSFLLLRGKCRECGERISPRYFAVELVTGLLFLFLYLKFGFSTPFFIYLLLSIVLVIIAFIDLEHYLIPNLFTYPGVFVGLILSFFFPFLQNSGTAVEALKWSSLGILVGGGSLALIALLGQFLFKKESMGMGDMKLLAMMGAFMGPRAVLLIIFVSCVIGAIVGLSLIALGKKKREDYIPYGPFLALGGVVLIFWGDLLVKLFS